MKYQELMEKLLGGKSVNSVAHEMGVPQKSLDRYVKGESVPGVAITKQIAERAQVPLHVAIDAVAEYEVSPRKKRGSATAAGLALCVAVNLFLTPTSAEAAPVLKQSTSPVYIM